MKGKTFLSITTLEDQVYKHLRYQMRIGKIRPGAVIDMNGTSQKLGISRTPLRDALIQLEMEGFVKILPRRGVVVNKLTIQDIKEWEVDSIKEHKKLTELLSQGKYMDAADYIWDVHWSFKVQERFIRKYYSDEIETKKNEGFSLYSSYLTLHS